MRKVGGMTTPPRTRLELSVVSGPDAGRSFRYSGEAPVSLRRWSDPDDDGLALRTDEADGVHLVLTRTPDGWTVERREGPALKIDGVSRERARLDAESTICVGGTVLEVAFVAARPPGARVASPGSTAERVEGYEWMELVSEGAQARTWHARRIADGVEVALKVVRPEAGEAARRDLRRAADIAKLLVGQPHAAQFVDADLGARTPWLALAWVEGEPVEDLVAREGPMAIPDACAVAAQILRVLDAIHAKEHVHRDIHPGNILRSDRSVAGAPDAVLIDFGLGKAIHAEAGEGTLNPTQTGEWMGRPRFLAPEQAADGKHVKPAADLFGLAATLYWLLCSAPVVRELPGESILSAWARGHRIPIRRRRADIPESLAIAIDEALSRDPEVRWAARDRFRAEIERVAAGGDGK